MKYQKSTIMGCKDIGIRKSKFVTKTQFLSKIFNIVELKKIGGLNSGLKFSELRWNLKNFSRGLNLPKPGLN